MRLPNVSIGSGEPLRQDDRIHGLSGTKMEELRRCCEALRGEPGRVLYTRDVTFRSAIVFDRLREKFDIVLIDLPK